MSTKKWQSLGRLKSGTMNRTEKAYADYLEALKIKGEVIWFVFEGITLKIAKDCRLTMDFAVLNSNMEIELHDVKGSKFMFQDDSKVKIKVAAQMFPFRFKVVMPISKKSGGGWDICEF